MKSRKYSINPKFANQKEIPAAFSAKTLKETDRAIYVYGHGTLHPEGLCMKCGRTLTHPGSIVLGIGPVCLGSWAKRNIVLDNMSQEEIDSLAKEQIVDCWIPKSVIRTEQESNEEIIVPKNHKMLNGKTNMKREATQVMYKDSGDPAIKITFPFNYNDLANVKSLPGRRFNSENKHWIAPLKLESVMQLKEWGFSLDAQLKEVLKKAAINIDTAIDEIFGDENFEVPGLQKPLYPFQKKGVAFIEAKNGRALIADEMGLGKTVQAIGYLQLHPEKRPAVIVCPASLKLNWEKELSEWTNTTVQILNGTKTDISITSDIIIINYDILNHWLERIIEIKPKILIMDECHYIKNNKAKRTKAVKRLGKHIPSVIGLSGTPIINRPVEIYNALSLIDNTVVPSFWNYVQTYCGAKKTRFGWDFNGATKTDELNEMLTNTIMLRRKKEDVLSDLPAKQLDFIPIELDNEKEYKKVRNDLIDTIDRAKKEQKVGAAVLNAIEKLKQTAVKGKMKESIKFIRDFIDTGEKLVVFCTHKETINQLMEAFTGVAVKIDGSVSMHQRDEAVDQFQNNSDIKLFVGNIKAAGVGLTLTASSNVAFLELPWTPGELTQAEDRCHRIGQKNSVNIYHLLATGTIEEWIARKLDEKKKVLDSVLDGQETTQESLIMELINEVHNEK